MPGRDDCRAAEVPQCDRSVATRDGAEANPVTCGMTSTSKSEFVPYLSITGAARAVAFYAAVFGVAPRLVLTMPDGRVMHCEFRVGTSRFFVSEELLEHGGTTSPTHLGATTVAIHLYVDNCDAMVATMKAHGATVLMEPTDAFWGERFARVRDPFGHEWGITSVLRDMSPDEIQAAARLVT
jgi:PhnB protein